MERNLFQNFMISLRGVAMGAADIVPGVSGGTIAFITGIYEELIDSISKINFGALKILKKEGLKSFWSHINGTFFLFLFGGIGVSLFSLAKVVLYLLTEYPVLLWSFFFGLIIASIWMVGKTVSKWNISAILSLLIGTGIALYVSMINTAANVEADWYVFLSGMIAICAMILPGISGSFILVLLGSYHVVLSAAKNIEYMTLGLFLAGCVIGLLSFARFLKFLFKNYKSVTISLLTGFMVGSLYKVWPWKNELFNQFLYEHSDGRKEFAKINVMPSEFNGDSQLAFAIALSIVGFVLILILDKLSPKENG